MFDKEGIKIGLNNDVIGILLGIYEDLKKNEEGTYLFNQIRKILYDLTANEKYKD